MREPPEDEEGRGGTRPKPDETTDPQDSTTGPRAWTEWALILNNTCLACSTMTYEQAHDALFEVAMRAVDYDIPWSEACEDARAALRRMYPVETAAARRAALRAQFDEWDAEDVEVSASPTWSAIDLYRAEGLPAPRGLLGEHVLCPQSIALVIGEGGTGKTYLVLVVGRYIADGKRFGTYGTRCADVLFLSEEMTEAELRARLHELFTEAELTELGDRLKFRCRSGIRIDTDEGIANLRRLIEEEGYPGLVILDALSDIHMLDENSNSQMGPALKRVRDEVATPTGCCIVIIHHAGKPGEFLKGANRSRGASAMRDIAADVLTVDRNADGSRTVRFAKVRHGAEPEPFNFTLVQDEESGLTTLEIGAGTGLGPSEFKATGQLLELIRENGGAMTPVDLRDAAMSEDGGLQWSKATYYRHQKAALESGYMVKDDSVAPPVLRPAKAR